MYRGAVRKDRRRRLQQSRVSLARKATLGVQGEVREGADQGADEDQDEGSGSYPTILPTPESRRPLLRPSSHKHTCPSSMLRMRFPPSY